MLNVNFTGYVRMPIHDRTFGVVNDFVGSVLATAMGVPTPANTLMSVDGWGGSGSPSYGHMTVSYGTSGQQPAPPDPAEAAADDPWAATGILVLDGVTLNEDRYENYLKLPGHQLVAIDHDGCLFGHDVILEDKAIELLDATQAKPLSTHPFAGYLDGTHLASWKIRATSIRREEIVRLTRQCQSVGLVTTGQRKAIERFLLYRLNHVGMIVDHLFDIAETIE